MNHLAHALVAHRAGSSIAGNLMGDFVKGDPSARWNGPLREGILLHRRVDAFADDHPAFARSRARLQPPFRRWAGILVDVFWDHVLARSFEEYCETPLRPFADGVYAEIRREWAALPERMIPFATYLVDADLLVAYREPEGVARAFAGMSRRVRRANPLGEAMPALERARAGLDADFREFFPELLVAVG